jgi:hypothetical protein
MLFLGGVARLDLDHDALTYTSHIAGIKGVYHFAQLAF